MLPLVFLGNLGRPELFRHEGPVATWIQVRNVTDETAVARDIPERRQAVSAERSVMKSWIQKSPGVCGGEPCVRNTRHTVAGLVEWKKQGLTDARILEHHPDLTQVDLDIAWAYYASHRAQIEQTLKEAGEA